MSTKKLPTLYKKAVTGKVQQWTIEIKGDSYRTISGQVAGKLTRSKFTKCIAKNVGRSNELTPKAQASAEAQAKWQKKINEGYYKTRAAATKNGDSKFFKVMLAESYADYGKDLVFPVCAQPKLDGIRCVISKNNGAMSRNGKPIVCVQHILKELEPFFALYPNAVLDGELYTHALHDDFNAIVSMVKKQKPTEADLALSASKIQYWVYDCSFGDTAGFEDRFNKLKVELALLGIWQSSVSPADTKPSSVIIHTPTFRVDTGERLDELYGEFLENGFEGQMVRVLAQPYQHKRTKYLLKRKEFIDEEYTIQGVVEGVGNRVGTVGYFEFTSKSGKPFRSNVKGSFEYIKKLWENRQSLIGKEATIKYFRLTPDGVPRFPYVIKIDRKSYE